MKAREGDYLETLEGLIFDVKGLLHPLDRVIASIRWVPDPEGDRNRAGVKYRKVYGLGERRDLLIKRFPQYIVYDEVLGDHFCEVPIGCVKQHHKPQSKMKELLSRGSADDVEETALKLASLLKAESEIAWKNTGVTGSVLLGLHGRNSDIDLIIYGAANCVKVHRTLRQLLQRGTIKPFDKKELKKLYASRSRDTPMPFESFVFHEGRKVIQGTFKGRDYFIRFVKDFDEVERYGDFIYKPEGYAEIEATVTDDSGSIFTPCRYGVGDVRVLRGVDKPISELASFRGRFCEQAEVGEKVVAKGKVEAVKRGRNPTSYRMVLGNVGDFMMVVS